MNYAWLTDPHFDFMDMDGVESLAKAIGAEDVDGLFVTGDISEASLLRETLEVLSKDIPFPVYFVLGNHDYYGSSIPRVRKEIREWSDGQAKCFWMPASGVVSLTATTALIGHGGWGDGRVGDFMRSSIMLNDYLKIEDLRFREKRLLLEKLNALGDEAAEFIAGQLSVALESHDEVVLLTHVPPFLEATWHEGQAVLSEWTPHFACGAVGERLVEIMKAQPQKSLRVLCGHTHGEGEANMLPNLAVSTGGAVYGAPALQSHIRIK